MNRFKTWCLLGAVAVGLSSFAVGCSSSSSSGGGGSTSSGVVDMIVGDHGWDTNVSQILIWFDVLNSTSLSSGTTTSSVPVPNVVLTLPPDLYAPHFAIQGNDLFVEVNTSGPTSGSNVSEIQIYRNYLGLTSASTPDVVLSGLTAGLNYPWGLEVRNNMLFIADAQFNGGAVTIFNNTDSLTSASLPSVILNSTTSLLTDPRGVVYDGINDKLFVGNWSSSAADPCVAIFSAVTGIISGGVAVTPSVVLSAGTLTTVAPNLDGCREVLLDNDTLYVAGGYDGYAYVFNGANALTNNALPDVILQGTLGPDETNTNNTPSMINTVSSLAIFNSTLFVANRNDSDPNCCSTSGNPTLQRNPGLVGFTPAHALVNGNGASITFNQDSFLNTVNRVAFAGGAMFVTGDGATYHQFNVNSVYIYKNASNLKSNQLPDIFIPGNADPTLSPWPSVAGFDSPNSLLVHARSSF